MNRTLLLVVVAVVPALLAGAGGYVYGRFTPGHTTVKTTIANGIIVARTIELKLNGANDWQAVEPRGNAAVTAASIDRSVTAAESSGADFALNVRYRLTIRDTSTPAPYDVITRGVCYDAVTVGSAWPNHIAACR